MDALVPSLEFYARRVIWLSFSYHSMPYRAEMSKYAFMLLEIMEHQHLAPLCPQCADALEIMLGESQTILAIRRAQRNGQVPQPIATAGYAYFPIMMQPAAPPTVQPRRAPERPARRRSVCCRCLFYNLLIFIIIVTIACFYGDGITLF